jgi:tRNA dimethylallyltransferase
VLFGAGSPASYLGCKLTSVLHVICGPTASGKTALAIQLAQRLGAEIVSADSQQVYRYFDIGTAKPSQQELAAVRHHLVSVVDPMEKFSAARYQALADQAIAEIRSRGREVVVAGGTGLYVRVLLHGVIEGPKADPALREELEALSDEALHQRLRAIDSDSATRLPARDRVRAIRAIEIHAATGRPASASRSAHAFSARRHEYRLWVLEPEREALYAAINARTKGMFASGLVDEARSLVQRGYLKAAPMRSVGYAQALQVIDGAFDEARAIELAAQATRRYAKRQLTWFRKEQGAVFLKPPFSASALL